MAVAAMGVEAVEALILAVEEAGARAKAAEEEAKALRESLMARLKAEGLLVAEDDGGIRYRGEAGTVTLVTTTRESFIKAEEAMELGTIPPRYLKKALKLDAAQLKALMKGGVVTPDQVRSLYKEEPSTTESLRISRPSK